MIHRLWHENRFLDASRKHFHLLEIKFITTSVDRIQNICKANSISTLILITERDFKSEPVIVSVTHDDPRWHPPYKNIDLKTGLRRTSLLAWQVLSTQNTSGAWIWCSFSNNLIWSLSNFGSRGSTFGDFLNIKYTIIILSYFFWRTEC